MLIYGFRIILDFKQADIFRDIEISENDSFEDLHNSIIQAFSIDSGEMASFYKSNDHWNQGEEISLFAINENTMVMSEINLSKICTKKGDKLLYIFDFLKMWTFYVELMEINGHKSGISYPRLIYSEGIMPGEREDIQFESENHISKENNKKRYIDDDIFESFDNFDQYD